MSVRATGDECAPICVCVLVNKQESGEFAELGIRERRHLA